jgi:hypothetical protein
VSITRAATAALSQRRIEAELAAELAGCKLALSGFVFSPDPTGQAPWPPSIATCRWKGLRDEAELGRVRLHDLRHFVATELLSAGVDIRTVSNRVGHGRPSTTSDIYWAWVRRETVRRLTTSTSCSTPTAPRGKPPNKTEPSAPAEHFGTMGSWAGASTSSVESLGSASMDGGRPSLRTLHRAGFTPAKSACPTSGEHGSWQSARRRRSVLPTGQGSVASTPRRSLGRPVGHAPCAGIGEWDRSTSMRSGPTTRHRRTSTSW